MEERKFGLTFQSPADAISFERGLQSVLEKLDRGKTITVITENEGSWCERCECSLDVVGYARILPFITLLNISGSDSPSSSTPEEGDTEDDGQAVSVFITSVIFSHVWITRVLDAR